MKAYQLESLDLAASQEEAINQIIAEMRASGLIRSGVEEDSERKRLEEMITAAGQPAFKALEQSGLAQSDPINQNLREADLDLRTLFLHLGKIDAELNKHQRLHQSVLQSMKIAVRKLEDQLEYITERLARNLGSNTHFESFRDPSSFETDQSLYTEADGSPVPEASRAVLDLDREGIKLPVVHWENALISPTGIKLGRIRIVKKLGTNPRELWNPQSDVDRAIDGSMETFWSESIFTESPIKVALVDPDDPDYYCGIQHGAACELEITFDSITVINEISFTPYAEHPVQILAVRAYTSDDPNEPYVDLISPKLADIGRGPAFTLEPVVYQLPDTPVKRLRILLNQIHYTREEILVSTREERKTEMILSAAGTEEPKVEEDAVFAPVWASHYEADPSLMTVQRMMLDQAEPDIERLMDLTNEEEIVPMTVFHYQYGMYDIGVKRREYADAGVYVSQPITSDKGLQGVSLSVTEEHPVVPGMPRVTHIEYSVSPDGKTWYPILPLGQEKVEGEVIKVSPATRSAPLRFRAAQVLQVYENGQPVSFTASAQEVTVAEYHSSSIYTVDYIPEEGQTYVDFAKAGPIREIYRQYGTDRRGRLMLPDVPYVNYQKLSAGIQPSASERLSVTVTLQDGSRITAVDVTDYLNPVNNLDPTSADLQFQVIGPRQIQFNRPIDSTTLITVEYPTVAKSVRLRAILRRSGGDPGLTPVLKDYILHMR